MPSSGPVYVLGVGLSHNGAACLLKDGKVEVAIEKERITKVKGDGGNDKIPIDYCLRAAGIEFDDLSLIVQNANFGAFAYGNNWYRGERSIPDDVPVKTISHHLAHAYSAYFLSPFDDAAILVVDGCGNSFEDCTDLVGSALGERPDGELASLWFEKDSYYVASGTDVRPIYKDFSPMGRVRCEYPMHPTTTRHSIGGIYAGASKYMFGNVADLGKLMGLAPYGRVGAYNHEIFDVGPDRILVNYDWMSEFNARALTENDFAERFQYFADIALMVQREIERALLAVVNARHAMNPKANLCFAGGVALNAVANQRILRETAFEKMFIPPAADDSGLAIGCAYFGWHVVLGRERVRHKGTPFLGRSYDGDSPELAAALAVIGDDCTILRPVNMADAMADVLAQGNTLAWHRGGAEFGPRALGHRSILADPRRAELRDYINKNIKFREDFRPFAPAVMVEDADVYFELSIESPYMLFVVPVRESWRSRIGAVVHVDGTARVQTVSEELDPEFHELLGAFKRRSGVSLLLNTSMNRRGEPIVETPQEAVALFRETGLHGLVVGQYLILKGGVSLS